MVTCKIKDDFDLLVDGAKAGDGSSLDHLVGIAEPKLRAHFLRMTLDIDLTADLVQETMLRMIRSIGQLENTQRFWPWLFRIASNLLKDHYRKGRRPSVTRFSAMAEHHLENVLKDESSKPERPVLRGELCAMLNTAIASLKEKPRTILAMRCFENMSYAQISTEFGCSEVAVRTTFSRAKKSIKRHLHGQGLQRL